MANAQQTRISAHLALLGANLIYGIGFSVAKTIMPSKIEPQGFILLRVLLAGILLWSTALLGPQFRARIDKADYPRLIFCGATGIAINMLLFFTGLSLTTPIHGSLMMLATPILVILLSAFVLKQGFETMQIFGIGLGVVGAAILVLSRQSDAIGSNTMLGDIFILINAASYAVYLIAVKPLMQRYRPIVVLRYVFLVGFVMVLPFGYSQAAAVQWHTFTQMQWGAFAFIVLGVTFLTYVWNIYAIAHLSSHIAGAYIYAQPLFAATISILFFHEQLSIQKIIAALLIFCGVYFATRQSKATPSQSKLQR